MDSLRPLMEDEHLLEPARLELLRRVAKRADMPAYIVGGFARDLLLRRRVSDFDIVVEGNAIALARSLAKNFGGKVLAHANFGTAKWTLNDGSFLDFITARRETYKHPAALPTVEFAEIGADIRRRDFTINTLAVRLDGKHLGELRDDLHGRDDLEKGIVRVLHDRSFIDDPTRMFRAARYEQRYGFRIASETLALIPAALPVVEKLSAKRVRHELDLIFDEPNAIPMLARLAELGMLRAIHSDLPAFEARYVSMLDSIPDKELGMEVDRRALGYSLWLSRLTANVIESISQRLAFTSELKKTILAASSALKDLPSLIHSRPSQWTARLDDAAPLAVYVVWLISGEDDLRTYLSTWRHVKPKTTGHDLTKRGLAAGPKYREILSRLRAARLDGEIKTNEEESHLLDNLCDS